MLTHAHGQRTHTSARNCVQLSNVNSVHSSEASCHRHSQLMYFLCHFRSLAHFQSLIFLVFANYDLIYYSLKIVLAPQFVFRCLKDRFPFDDGSLESRFDNIPPIRLHFQCPTKRFHLYFGINKKPSTHESIKIIAQWNGSVQRSNWLNLCLRQFGGRSFEDGKKVMHQSEKWSVTA